MPARVTASCDVGARRARVALPDKPLSLEIINIEFTPDGVGHIVVNLSRDGTPVPYGPPVQFGVSLNGQAINPVTTEKASTNPASDN